MTPTSPLIIANASGFFGDRFTAAAEMVRGGPIHVLTGDYLAELTMAILTRQKQQDPSRGYASTFPKQIKSIMAECLDKGIKIVSNAGGMNPHGLAQALQAIAAEQGLNPKIAAITGDDLLPSLPDWQKAGEPFAHLETGLPLKQGNAWPVSANAYLGGWGIAEALRRGADIVVTGRVADAALVLGTAVWHFNWARDDWDKLAGAITAGHIIECGPQCTGGNYPFIHEIPTYRNIGFPIAEIYPDGSSVITKHPGTGGLVSIGTVTAQLLYEIGTPAYLTSDVTTHFNSIQLSQEAPDRVRVSGVKGSPPPDSTKVTINTFGGFRNDMTIVLTGLDIERKAEIVQQVLWESLGGRAQFGAVHEQLIRSDKPNPPSNEEACAYLKISVMDMDKEKVGRNFSAKVVELALANIPGFNLTAPPDEATPFIKHWPTLFPKRHLTQTILLDGETFTVAEDGGISRQPSAIGSQPLAVSHQPSAIGTPHAPLSTPHSALSTQLIPFGQLFGTRSGDKGGNANLGVWARSAEAYAWLVAWLTAEQLGELLPDIGQYRIERYELPNLWAVNFVIHGLLGDGVAAGVRLDAQAKTLGEYLRAKVIAVPVGLVG
jgi:hypothetical protein